jgi:hypothetical protein
MTPMGSIKQASLRAFYVFGSAGNTRLAWCLIFAILGLMVAYVFSLPLDVRL